MSQAFQIFRLAALTQASGNEGRQAYIVNVFYQLIKFLQDNKLMLHPMINSIEDVNDDFVLMSTDLTEEGVEVMKAAFYKWLEKTDKGIPPVDTTLLMKALNKIRKSVGSD